MCTWRLAGNSSIVTVFQTPCTTKMEKLLNEKWMFCLGAKVYMRGDHILAFYHQVALQISNRMLQWMPQMRMPCFDNKNAAVMIGTGKTVHMLKLQNMQSKCREQFQTWSCEDGCAIPWKQSKLPKQDSSIQNKSTAAATMLHHAKIRTVCGSRVHMYSTEQLSAHWKCQAREHVGQRVQCTCTAKCTAQGVVHLYNAW